MIFDKDTKTWKRERTIKMHKSFLALNCMRNSKVLYLKKSSLEDDTVFIDDFEQEVAEETNDPFTLRIPVFNMDLK